MNFDKNFPSLASHRLAYKPDNECTIRQSKIEECCTDNQKVKELWALVQKQVLTFAPKDFNWDEDELNLQIRKKLEEMHL